MPEKKPQHTIDLTVPSHPQFLCVTRAVIFQVCHCMRFPEKFVNCIALAVEEAFTNIIKYSYGNDYKKKVVLVLNLYKDRLEIVLKDFGKKVDVKMIKPRALEDVRPGGLGVYFIKKFMDEVTYDVSPEVGTELRLVKYLEKGGCACPGAGKAGAGGGKKKERS
ncbi:MAG TPA: ATP-binding protein [bacterium]|nr:ATP-binding protein [bacterium]